MNRCLFASVCKREEETTFRKSERAFHLLKIDASISSITLIRPHQTLFCSGICIVDCGLFTACSAVSAKPEIEMALYKNMLNGRDCGSWFSAVGPQEQEPIPCSLPVRPPSAQELAILLRIASQSCINFVICVLCITTMRWFCREYLSARLNGTRGYHT